MKNIRRFGLSAFVGSLAILPLTAGAGESQKDIPGPIDSLQDLQDTGKMAFKLADENNDGQISQREATDAGNLLVGGFFFRADTNGDGALSDDEIRQASEAFATQRPWLRYVMQRAKASKPDGNASAANTNQAVWALIDTNNDHKIQATELRQLVTTGVQSMYAAADTNRDGQLSPSEVNAGIQGVARGAVMAAFQKADADNNGQLSQAEFDKALIEPANAAFLVLDANNDGQISQQELQSAARIIAQQTRMLNVPEPANSAKHLIESGRKPEEVAPVPNINLNGGRTVQPAR